MTLDEAREIAAIVQTADGGCATCVANLVELLDEAFPQFVWKVGYSSVTVEYREGMIRIQR